MTPEEIRQQLHQWLDALPDEQLPPLQEALQRQQEKKQQATVLARIIAEEASLLKLLGR